MPTQKKRRAFYGSIKSCFGVLLRNAASRLHSKLFCRQHEGPKLRHHVICKRVAEAANVGEESLPLNNTNNQCARYNYIMRYTTKGLYSLLPAFLRFSFSLSRKNRLRILPDGDFGISSMNSMPPVIHL